MATYRVDVSITDAGVIRALNTPGGAMYEWRGKVEDEILDWCHSLAPINHKLNAAHRGGVVGTYKAGFRSSTIGSNGHWLRLRVYNVADHANIVEYGRSKSLKPERFAWKDHLIVRQSGKPPKYKWEKDENGNLKRVYYKPKPPKLIQWHWHGTKGRDGEHVIRDSVNATMADNCSGYTPLP